MHSSRAARSTWSMSSKPSGHGIGSRLAGRAHEVDGLIKGESADEDLAGHLLRMRQHQAGLVETSSRKTRSFYVFSASSTLRRRMRERERTQ
jgi:hypothetical protein